MKTNSTDCLGHREHRVGHGVHGEVMVVPVGRRASGISHARILVTEIFNQASVSLRIASVPSVSQRPN